MPVLKHLALRLTKALLRGMSLVLLLAACGQKAFDGGDSYPMYGIDIPPEPPDLSLRITDFSYQPISPLTIGTRLTFRAVLNHNPGANYYEISVYIDEGDLPLQKPPVGFATYLHDDGRAPDAKAGDLVYTGEWPVPLRITGKADLTVAAYLTWNSLADPPLALAAPLTVLPWEQ